MLKKRGESICGESSISKAYSIGICFFQYFGRHGLLSSGCYRELLWFLTYIGETKRRLKDRFNEHRRPVDKQTSSSKPTTVSEHFPCNNHNATDVQLIPLELVKSNRDSVRKTREAYLIERGQTLEPHGLNKKR